ncbi:hypothetical protein [Methanocella sp. MCL-LM]|uniref:hypothetical protein n=1 Tax=Methanocella sp. MCL-LM TaxID=3412035 RepID=UPI003C740FF2
MQRIEDAIKGGVDEKHLKIVKELKNYYYVEDIAAAALQLCAERGVETEEVRRRSHIHTHFIPLKTKETVVKAKATQKPPSQPAEPGRRPAHGTHRKPQHHPAKKPAPAAQPPRSANPQAPRKPSQAPRGNQPARSGNMPEQRKPAPAHGGNQQSRGGSPQAPRKPSPPRGNQPGRSSGDRPQKHHGAPSRSGDRRKTQ